MAVDYDAVAADLDREGAHEMLEKHLRQIAMSTILPGHFHAGDRDVDAATAAMMRILAIEGEDRGRDDVRAFVVKLARDKADAMVKDPDKYPIVFDDLWSL
jgi:predicted TPR repeat methyltransferase